MIWPAVLAVLKAIPALVKAGIVFLIFRIRNQVRNYEDEVISRSIGASPADILRIEQIKQRRAEDIELLGSLRSSLDDLD